MSQAQSDELKRVAELCDKHNIHTVECIIVDNWGVPRGKRLPTEQFLRNEGYGIANVVHTWQPRCEIEITPVQAGANWAVGWKKESFIGSDVLLSQKGGSVERKSVAIKSLDRGIPRAGMSVKNSKGDVVGEVTSGTFSPTLKHGIALALLSKDVAVGDELIVDVRGRDSLCEVVKLPFVTSHVR